MANQLLDAPAALTTDGRLLVGVTHVTGEQIDAEKALSRALKSGRRVFIGIEMTTVEVGHLWAGSTTP